MDSKSIIILILLRLSKLSLTKFRKIPNLKELYCHHLERDLIIILQDLSLKFIGNLWKFEKTKVWGACLSDFFCFGLLINFFFFNFVISSIFLFSLKRDQGLFLHTLYMKKIKNFGLSSNSPMQEPSDYRIYHITDVESN